MARTGLWLVKKVVAICFGQNLTFASILDPKETSTDDVQIDIKEEHPAEDSSDDKKPLLLDDSNN